MKIIVCVILGCVLVIASLVLVVVAMGKNIARLNQKLKLARLQVAALEAVYEEIKRAKEETAAKVAKLDTVDACITYMNGGKNE